MPPAVSLVFVVVKQKNWQLGWIAFPSSRLCQKKKAYKTESNKKLELEFYRLLKKAKLLISSFGAYTQDWRLSTGGFPSRGLWGEIELWGRGRLGWVIVGGLSPGRGART